MALSRITNPFLSSSGSNNTSITSPAANTLAFTTTTTERMRINSSGNFTVGKTDITTSVDGFAVLNTGETRISCSANDVLNLNRNTSNGAIQRFFRSGSLVGQIEGSTTGLTYTGINGLTFTASQSASADANTLDDYEEGTFTPTITGSSSNPSYTTSYAVGRYTKIGRIVHFNFLIVITAVATQGTGNIQISGFPFSSSGNYENVVKIGYNDTWETAFLSGYIGGTTMNIIPTGVTQSNAGFGGPNATQSPISTGYFAVSGTYQI